MKCELTADRRQSLERGQVSTITDNPRGKIQWTYMKGILSLERIFMLMLDISDIVHIKHEMCSPIQTADLFSCGSEEFHL